MEETMNATFSSVFDNDESIVDHHDINMESKEQSELMQKIQSLESELSTLQARRYGVAQSIKTVNKQYDRLTIYKNQVEKQYYSYEISQLHSIAMRTQSNRDWLALTYKINTLNDCFHIWHRGQYGTINGLRLGSDVPPIPIPEEVKWMSSSGNYQSSSISTANSPHSGGNMKTNDSSSSNIASRGISKSADSRVENNSRDKGGANSLHVNNGHITIPNSSLQLMKNNSSDNSHAQTHVTNNHLPNALSSMSGTHLPSKQYHPIPAPHSYYNHFKVPWSEINASLGTAALLLKTLEDNTNNPIQFRSHKIIPMGSFSKIVLLPVKPNTNKSPLTYNLHSDDSFNLFGKRNFNIALNALLKCLKDAADIALDRDKTMAFPHEIGYAKDLNHNNNNNNNVGNSSISSSSSTATTATSSTMISASTAAAAVSSISSSMSFYNNSSNKDDLCIGGLSISYGTDGERWTRAMKYFLTDLKWLVAFVVKHVER